jgi:tetratricopeptide (TPR) repeat protein
MREEMIAWTSFAQKQNDEALQHLRAAADLQDKVGQAEVDIPAREMLGDMLLELHRPQEALDAYRIALKLSPSRFNGLYHAGVAAEQAGDKASAGQYFAELLKTTQDGAHSARPELANARNFVTSNATATGNAGR